MFCWQSEYTIEERRWWGEKYFRQSSKKNLFITNFHSLSWDYIMFHIINPKVVPTTYIFSIYLFPGHILLFIIMLTAIYFQLGNIYFLYLFLWKNRVATEIQDLKLPVDQISLSLSLVSVPKISFHRPSFRRLYLRMVSVPTDSTIAQHKGFCVLVRQ